MYNGKGDEYGVVGNMTEDMLGVEMGSMKAEIGDGIEDKDGTDGEIDNGNESNRGSIS